ncbi:YukI-like protein [Bacillus mycoides]|uniref:YukJ family protein n=1 Tax=Bacillus mycoides TaxID=1405 RepID=UPI0005C86F89|nr:YukJ family protein [Bacillus mycoides]KIV62497.1 YukI-like protein [Bacillus mycoides]
MPVDNYGVLKGIAIKEQNEKKNEKAPHYQILMIGEENTKYRIAVNAKSVTDQPELLYVVDKNFDASTITILPNMNNGFTPIDENNQEIALDYLRSRLFDPSSMKIVPFDNEGNNDLHDLLNEYIPKAINEEATIYIYGSKFGPDDKPDKIFHLEPDIGMHNVHMNQGNAEEPGQQKNFSKDNGTYHDGGILIQYKDGHWVAIFLAFKSQSWCTDNRGYPTEMCTPTQANTNN